MGVLFRIVQPAGVPQAPPADIGDVRPSTQMSRFPAVAAENVTDESPDEWVLLAVWTVPPKAI